MKLFYVINFIVKLMANLLLNVLLHIHPLTIITEKLFLIGTAKYFNLSFYG